MFVDRIKVFAQAGKGGRGCVSFRREKFVPKGGPDGGDGGRGGDVILLADRHVDNLANLFYEPIIKAKNGSHGKGKKMAGRTGADKIVKVPVGTIVWRTGEEQRPTPINREQTLNVERPTLNRNQSVLRTPPASAKAPAARPSEMVLIVGLTRDGQELLICQGVKVGKGNVNLKISRN